MKDITILAVQLIITVIAFLVGKYVFPRVPEHVWEKLDTLSDWAANFVVWAREFHKDKTGPEKMAEVVKRLQEVAAQAGYDVTEEQLKAIAQKAYEAMKAGEASAGAAETVPLEAASTGPTIIINNGNVATATDDVPDGALEENEDGTVNVYDGNGNKVGTMPKEEAEAAASNVSGVAVEE